jgi:hypothetical protein
MLRGFLVSSPGIPPDALLRSIARMSGDCLSQELMGDLTSILPLRAAMKDEFCKAVDAVKSRPQPSLVDGQGQPQRPQ